MANSSGWKYYWDQNNQLLVIHDDQYSTGPITESEGAQYSTGPIRMSEGGVYRCRAGRGDPVYYTEYSDAVTLSTADGESFKNLLHVRAAWGQKIMFTPLSVFLSVRTNLRHCWTDITGHFKC